MIRKTVLALLLLAGLGHPALACDDQCKANEIYSDEAEMCVVVPQV